MGYGASRRGARSVLGSIMIIGTIVEGPTDRLLLKAIIDKVCPGEHLYRDLQPLDMGSSFGERGSGWKGVRQFCLVDIKQRFGTLDHFIIDHQIDLLVIHVDADVITESDLQDGIENLVDDVSQPCPPAIDKLQKVIASWLNTPPNELSRHKVVIAIPSQDSENWVFAGLFPHHSLCQQTDYECIYPLNSHQHPAFLLTKPEFRSVLQRKEGKIKKHRREYEAVLPEVMQAWHNVRVICPQAQIFHGELVMQL